MQRIKPSEQLKVNGLLKQVLILGKREHSGRVATDLMENINLLLS
jgi:hypothetical protein